MATRLLGVHATRPIYPNPRALRAIWSAVDRASLGVAADRGVGRGRHPATSASAGAGARPRTTSTTPATMQAAPGARPAGGLSPNHHEASRLDPTISPRTATDTT